MYKLYVCYLEHRYWLVCIYYMCVIWNTNIEVSMYCIPEDVGYNYRIYSGFLSWEKTFENCLKIDFHRENIRKFVVTQCTTPTSAVSNCLKIDFHRENFHEFVVTQCTTPTSAVSNCLKIDFHGETFANLR